jgi:hypothetical protein
MHTLIYALIIALLAPFAPAHAGDVLDGWTRRGSVYQRIDMDGVTPNGCAEMCTADGQCQSWVWTRAGMESPWEMCSLLSAAPTARRAPGHITGLSRRLTDRIDEAVTRDPSAREQAVLRAALYAPRNRNDK